MKTNDLGSQLRDLVERLEDCALRYSENKKIHTFKVRYVKPVFKEFEYTELGIRYKLRTEPQEKTLWLETDQSKFVKTIMRKLSEYETVANQLSAISDTNNRPGLTEALAEFTNAVVYAFQDDTLGQIQETYIEALLADATRDSVKWTCKSWITGIFLEQEPYDLGNGTMLRRPEPRDMPSEWVIDPSMLIKRSLGDRPFNLTGDRLLNPGLQYNFESLMDYPWAEMESTVVKLSGVLEGEINAGLGVDVYDKLKVILDSSLLFDTGAAFEIETVCNPNSFLHYPIRHGGVVRIPSPRDGADLLFFPRYKAEFYNYRLARKDVTKLANLFESLASVCPRGLLFLKRTSPVFIALTQFQNAFLNTRFSGIAGQITSATMALEALYLRGEPELKHRLSQRVAMVVQHFGIEPRGAYEVVREAYEIRSQYVHG